MKILWHKILPENKVKVPQCDIEGLARIRERLLEMHEDDMNKYCEYEFVTSALWYVTHRRYKETFSTKIKKFFNKSKKQ